MKKICKSLNCNKVVEPRGTPGKEREYCSPQCRDRDKKRRQRKERLEKGLCPQCGDEMIITTSPYKSIVTPQYCRDCQDYFRKRYKEQRIVQ